MTTIVMKETNHGVEIAYDSQTTSGQLKQVMRDHKVFKNGELIFGVAGDVLFNNSIRFLDIPKVGDENPFKWLVKTLVPLIREERKEVDSNDEGGLEVLVVVKGQLFKINGDLTVTRTIEGIEAIGSGEYFAIGALAAGASVQNALKIASQLDIYTSGPLYWTTAARMLQASALA